MGIPLTSICEKHDDCITVFSGFHCPVCLVLKGEDEKSQKILELDIQVRDFERAVEDLQQQIDAAQETIGRQETELSEAKEALEETKGG